MATKTDKSEKGNKTVKKTIIDVTHADSVPPSPNSKSVIVASRPILKDPMVVEESEDEATKPIAKAGEKNILASAVTEPMSSDQPAKGPTVAELAEAAAKDDIKPSDEKPVDDKPQKDEKLPATDEKDDEKSGQPNNQTIEAEAAQQAKHDAAIEKLTESKQYYLPIETIEKRRSKRFVAVGVLLSLLLIVAWADIALDAGLIQLNGVKPVTHFFSN
jgi:hypothetical protein